MKEKKKYDVFKRAFHRIRMDRKTFVLVTILRTLVVVTLIRSIFKREFESVAICALSLVLFAMPVLAEEEFEIDIPPLFEAIIYLFIYSAEILGEINHYYVLIPGWDTMLHTMNGFLCAAVGFSMIDLLNRHSKSIKLSPVYLTMVAFCFSMTVGVIWEFFEFAMDRFFYLDMQKDYVLTHFSTVSLDPEEMGAIVHIDDIKETIIRTADNEYVIEGGYLDPGLMDTMKDLFVNFIGAVAFSIIGYFYVSNRSKNKFAEDLFIRRQTEEERKNFKDIMNTRKVRAENQSSWMKYMSDASQKDLDEFLTIKRIDGPCDTKKE